jgi:transposase InsO family protein
VIGELAKEFSVRALCLALQVRRSGYYQWRTKKPGPRQRANEQLLHCIRQVHRDSRATYGSPRITRQLKREEVGCSRNRVARLMKLHGIRAKQKRPFRPRTTDNRHFEPVAPNRQRLGLRFGLRLRVEVRAIVEVPSSRCPLWSDCPACRLFPVRHIHPLR